MFLSFTIITCFMKIFRSSHLHVFFKIGALKNFEIFRIKKKLHNRCFLWTAFLKNSSSACFCIFLKVIKPKMWRWWRPNIYFFWIHFRETHRLMYKKSNSFCRLIGRHLSGFLKYSVRVYPIKLKTGMLYHMHNTFWSTIF